MIHLAKVACIVINVSVWIAGVFKFLKCVNYIKH